MDEFEERIFNYLKENRGKSFTVFQVANYVGTAGAGLLLGNAGGYAVGVQMVHHSLENLVSEGYVAKKVMKQGALEDTYFYAK